MADSNIFFRLLYALFFMFSSIWFGGGTDSDYQTAEQNITQAPVLISVEEPEKPAMVEAYLEGDTDGYYIKNAYDPNSALLDITGAVGVPVEIGNHMDGIGQKTSLVFVYEEDELICDEECLGVLWYNPSTKYYTKVPDYEVNVEDNKVTLPVANMGIYILEDMEMWEGIWNGTYAYNRYVDKEPICHWHNEFDFRDIEKLADVSIYDGSKEYHITTVEQLAGLVKLVNFGESFSDCDFYLDADLDLAGYQWAPIGWFYPPNDGQQGKRFAFEGRFHGNGHAIYNMQIEAPDQSCVGMFGSTKKGFEVHDLALIDCYIEGRTYVGGIFGTIEGIEDFEMTNCFVSGTVKGSRYAGALSGTIAFVDIKNCSAVMDQSGTTEFFGSYRTEYPEDCHINDDAAREVLEQYK